MLDFCNQMDAMYQISQILKAIGESYFEIEHNTSLSNAINVVLQKLGEATRVDRVYVFKNHLNEFGEKCMTYKYEWCAPEVEAQLGFEYLHSLPWSNFPEIELELKKNKVINGLVSRINNKDFHDAMVAQGILSFLFVPIFCGPYFWGYIGFDNCSREELFDADQVFSLHALASTIGTKLLNRSQHKKLVKSRKSYFELINNINDVVFRLDQSGVIKFINPVWKRVSGYSSQQSIGRNIFDFFDADFLPIIRQKLAHVWDGLVDEGELELKLRKKNGEFIWVKAFAKVLKNKSGEIKGVTGTIVDINKEKQIMLALEESQSAQSRLNELLQAVNEAHLSFYVENDFQTPLEVFLDKILQITGSQFGFIGEVLTDENNQPFLRSHTLSNISWDKSSAEFFRANYSKGLEFRNLDTLFGYTLKTGEVVISNDVSSDPRAGHTTPAGHPPLRRYLGIPVKKGGRFIGMMGFANKPTDYSQEDVEFLQPLISGYANLISAIRINRARKEAEFKRKQADDKYRLVSENTNDIIALHDKDMRFLYVSPSIEKVLGVKPESLLGKRPAELFDVKEHLATDSLESQKFVLPHVHMVTKEQIFLEILMSPLTDSEGKVYNYLATSRDVTQRENMLKELKEMLAREKELNQLKTRFISMTSHEFRTPLATILSSTDILSLVLDSDAITDRVAEKFKIHLSRINQQVERLTKVIADLLLIGKSNQDKVLISEQSVEFVSFVKNIVDYYPAPEGRKLHISIDTNEAEVVTDPIWLSHIINNLIDNAFKYSVSKKDPVVSLEKHEKCLIVSVRDFGIGIPSEEQKYIFESFFRAKNANTIKGTGLGLNIVKDFASRLGIEVSFQSKENEGTEFKLIIPYEN